MQVDRYQNGPSFRQVHVSADAEKLLKRADLVVRNTTAKFLNTNVPEGHTRPLWSVLKSYLVERQNNNKNDIVIDMLIEKGKKLISVKTYDSKSVLKNKENVSPFIRVGSLNEVEPPADNLTYSAYKKSLDRKVYAKSDFFNAIENAEFKVDALHLKDLNDLKEVQVSIRELPKEKKIKVPGKKSEKVRIKKQQRVKKEQELVTPIQREEIHKPEKLKVSTKERVPRALKKRNSSNPLYSVVEVDAKPFAQRTNFNDSNISVKSKKADKGNSAKKNVKQNNNDGPIKVKNKSPMEFEGLNLQVALASDSLHLRFKQYLENPFSVKLSDKKLFEEKLFDTTKLFDIHAIYNKKINKKGRYVDSSLNSFFNKDKEGKIILPNPKS